MPGFDVFVPLTALFASFDPLEPTLGGKLAVIVVATFFGLFVFKCATR